jgi:prepilin-type N-terminal cleavage/methylation domain-containing protein
MMRKCSPGHAFTLIEVLVVVAIIALLISVLMPSLARSRDQAQMVVCKTRLKELYNGHYFYSQESKGRFPHWDWWLWDNAGGASQKELLNKNLYAKFGGARPTDSSVWVTFGQIYKFVRNPEVYFCPKDTKKRIGNSIGNGTTNGARPINSFVRFIEPHDFIGYHNKQPNGYLADVAFLNPDSLKPGVFVSDQTKAEGTFYSVPNKVGLLYEENPYTDDTLMTISKRTGNEVSVLNDGYSGFFFSGYSGSYGGYNDYMAARHFNKGDVLFWDGHTDMVDGMKFNRFPTDKYAAYTVLGGRKQ